MLSVASSEETLTWATALMLIFAPDRLTSVTMSGTTRSSVRTSSLSHSTLSTMGTMIFAPPEMTRYPRPPIPRCRFPYTTMAMFGGTFL